MLKKSREFLSLKRKALKLISDDIVDIAVFGSSVKGKIDPTDIDIAVIYRKEVKRDTLQKFQDALGEKCHISSLVVDQFFTKPHTLAKTLLFEGISLITNRQVSATFDMRAFTLYTYNLKKEQPSKKVRFVYLLKGRKGDEGIVRQFKGRYISPSSFLLPAAKDEEMIEILKQWGIKFYREKLFLMY